MKKEIVGIFVCTLLIAATVPSVAEIINVDKNDVEIEATINPMPTFAPWDLQKSFDVEASSGALGNAGAEFVRDPVSGTGYFYTTRWATNLIHQYDIDGNLLKEFSIPGVSGLRDLAYNPKNGYLYGGAAGGTIWGFDPIGETLEVTMTNIFQCRAIAYDDDLNVFYVSNWGDPVWIVENDTGDILGQFDLVTTTSTYGFAYDNVCNGGGPYLWVFDQGGGAGTPQYIYQWELGSGFTAFSYDVTLDISGTAGIAGGLFFTTDLYTPATNATLGGLLQGTPDMMFCYEICDAVTDTIPPVTTHIFTPASPDGANGWYVTCPTITLTATDVGCGVANTYYSIDGARPFSLYTPGTPIGPISDCEHTLEYYSDDCAANTEPINGPFTFKVDTIAPISLFYFSIPLGFGMFCLGILNLGLVKDVCSGLDKVAWNVNAIPNPPLPITGVNVWKPIVWFRPGGPCSDAISAEVFDVAGNSAVFT